MWTNPLKFVIDLPHIKLFDPQNSCSGDPPPRPRGHQQSCAALGPPREGRCDRPEDGLPRRLRPVLWPLG